MDWQIIMVAVSFAIAGFLLGYQARWLMQARKLRRWAHSEAGRKFLDDIHRINEGNRLARLEAENASLSAELERVRAALRWLLRQIDDVERTSVIREGNIYHEARDLDDIHRMDEERARITAEIDGMISHGEQK